ncbi:MAG: DHH family phosphoesterase [Bacteroidota bacterium]|jgi:phosphoesterase RecJ-like protein
MIPIFPHSDLEKLKHFLSQPRDLVVTTHHRPDGDAMGSSLALGLFLEKRGHRVSVVTPSDYPDFLKWIPGQHLVLNAEFDPEKAKDSILKADGLFCLDFNTPSRTEKLANFLVETKAVKIMVDHHLDPAPFCDITFSYNQSCATSELIYHVLLQLGGSEPFDRGISACIYTGIMTDTGSFRFASMSSDTHRIIAHLMECGVSNHEIHEEVYDNFSIDRTRFLGYCINEKLTVLPEYRAAYIAISNDELEKFNHSPGDTEGVVNFALGIKGIRLAAFFCERDGMVKISFRSKGDFSVKEMASLHFSGGGHANAAGGRSLEGLESAVQKFLEVLPSYSERLNP